VSKTENEHNLLIINLFLLVSKTEKLRMEDQNGDIVVEDIIDVVGVFSEMKEVR